MSVSEKRVCIEPEHEALSIARQCALLRLPRSSFYRSGGNLSGVSQEDLELMRLIDELGGFRRMVIHGEF
jgi:putative transposase